MSPVSLSKSQALAERMEKLGLREEDLDESFIRSGGKGGQNVNKVSTCVLLVHRPSGMTVKCQLERTQGMNRYRARVMLADKIERQILGEKSAEAERIAKVQRQKRRRSRRAKEKLLQDKHARSQTKVLRSPVRSSSGDE